MSRDCPGHALVGGSISISRERCSVPMVLLPVADASERATLALLAYTQHKPRKPPQDRPSVERLLSYRKLIPSRPQISGPVVSEDSGSTLPPRQKVRCARGSLCDSLALQLQLRGVQSARGGNRDRIRPITSACSRKVCEQYCQSQCVTIVGVAVRCARPNASSATGHTQRAHSRAQASRARDGLPTKTTELPCYLRDTTPSAFANIPNTPNKTEHVLPLA